MDWLYLTFRGKLIVTAIAGVVTAQAFAPLSFYPAAIVGPLICLYFWLSAKRYQAFILGWVFNFSLLASAGYWLSLSATKLADIGSPVAELLAAIFIAVMSLYLALAGWLVAYLKQRLSKTAIALTVFPALWIATEMLRSWALTGFPWFALGYSQIDSFLSGWAPLLGVYGVSLGVVYSAVSIWLLWQYQMQFFKSAMFIILLLWVGGAILQPIQWTEEKGKTVSIALVQSNNSQKSLLRKDRWPKVIETTQKAWQKSDIVIWPETLFTLYAEAYDREDEEYFWVGDRKAEKKYWTQIPFLQEQQIPNSQKGNTQKKQPAKRRWMFAKFEEEGFSGQLESMARAENKSVLLGLKIYSNQSKQRFNSMMMFSPGIRSAYHKRHLVPFGEILPLEKLLAPLWEHLDIDDSDFNYPKSNQFVMNINGVKAGVSICYESAYQEESLKALPNADFLIMSSNDNMFQNTAELPQHHRIARMRALESGRWVARVTKTGITSVIDNKGQTITQLPRAEFGILYSDLHIRSGSTPFVVWGNIPLYLWLLGSLLMSAGLTKSRNVYGLKKCEVT